MKADNRVQRVKGSERNDEALLGCLHRGIATETLYAEKT